MGIENYYTLTLFDNEGKFKNLYFYVTLYIKHPPQISENYTLNVENSHEVLALVDTGATICGISKRTVRAMGLKAYDEGEFFLCKRNFQIT